MESTGSWRDKRGNGGGGASVPPSFTRGGGAGGARSNGVRPNAGDGRAHPSANSRHAAQPRNHNLMGAHSERSKTTEPPPVVLMAIEQSQPQQGRSAPPRAADFNSAQGPEKLNGPLLILDINGVLL